MTSGRIRALAKLLETALDQPQQLAESTRHSLVLRQPGQPDRMDFLSPRQPESISSIRDWPSVPQRRNRFSSARVICHRPGGHPAWPEVAGFPVRIQSPDLSIDAGALGQISGPVRLLVLTSLQSIAMNESTPTPDAGRRRGSAGCHSGLMPMPIWRRLPRLVSGRYTADMSLGAGILSGRTGIGPDSVA